MKLIITAGGTSEKIDQVRKITNRGTGRLGSLTAEEFVRQGGSRIEKIYYLCEHGAAVPQIPCVEIIFTQGVEEVREALTVLLTRTKIDAVVHSMAVSDYAVESMTTAEDLAASLAEKLFLRRRWEFRSEGALAEYLADCIEKNDRLIDRSRKVGSGLDHMMLVMKRTPKLIGLVKAMQPSTVLVGFKLLDGVGRKALLDAACRVLTENSCDLVLANDQTEIRGDRHVGYLLSADKSFTRYESKAEIARGIAGKVLNLMDEREKQ